MLEGYIADVFDLCAVLECFHKHYFDLVETQVGSNYFSELKFVYANKVNMVSKVVCSLDYVQVLSRNKVLEFKSLYSSI
jgi:hypothetical protein